MTRSFPVAISLSEVLDRKGKVQRDICRESDPSVPPAPPEFVAPRGGEWSTRPWGGTRGLPQLLIERGTWLPAAVCRRVTGCRSLSWHGCWLSLALRTLKSLHTQPSGAKIQAVLERYHGAYRTSINATGRVYCTLDIDTLSAFALHLLYP